MPAAFLFPGQGSQSIGMLNSLAGVFPQVEKTFAEASAVLGYDLWQLLQQGPEAELARTVVTQPLMLTAGVAVWRVWHETGGDTPHLMAGHSLGEYSALVCAGSIDFAEAVALVRNRGEFMQQAVPEGQGGMVAVIGPDAAAVDGFCQTAAQGEVLSVANYNSPVQTIVAGTSSAIARLVEIAGQAGAKRVLRLPVSAPFHCQLMQPATEMLIPHLAALEIRPPLIPVINNVDACRVSDPGQIRDALIRQIANPVRWVELVEKIVAEGIQLLVECGPGKVLLGLNKRIAGGLVNEAMYDADSLRKVKELLPRAA